MRRRTPLRPKKQRATTREPRTVPATPTRRRAAAEPERTCIGCRRKRPQSELVRIAHPADGPPTVGRTAPGRGAWVCAGSIECFDLATSRQAWHRALRRPVPHEVIEALRARLFG